MRSLFAPYELRSSRLELDLVDIAILDPLLWGFRGLTNAVAEFNLRVLGRDPRARSQPSRCQKGCQPPIGDELTSTT